ncbi:MAG: prolipoprotein diacylglyceryl transferase [Oligoflexia bacterium]|nr:prolipoprotein diacylglyceryl transferase [Oligoflexia bacterium]
MDTHLIFAGVGAGVAFSTTHYLSPHPQNWRLLPSFVMALLLVWIGAKIFFIVNALLSGVNLQHSHSFFLSATFWLGGGGLVFHGALVGLLLALPLFPKQTISPLFIGLSFGHAIGRVGCFIANCCYGKLCSHNYPWCIDGRYPVQLYEALLLLLLGFFLLLQIKSAKIKVIPYLYLFLYSCMRFLLEFLRGDDEIRGMILFFSSAQWFFLILMLVAIALPALTLKRHIK